MTKEKFYPEFDQKLFCLLQTKKNEKESMYDEPRPISTKSKRVSLRCLYSYTTINLEIAIDLLKNSTHYKAIWRLYEKIEIVTSNQVLAYMDWFSNAFSKCQRARCFKCYEIAFCWIELLRSFTLRHGKPIGKALIRYFSSINQ